MTVCMAWCSKTLSHCIGMLFPCACTFVGNATGYTDDGKLKKVRQSEL